MTISVTFSANDLDYIAKLNSMITQLNADLAAAIAASLAVGDQNGTVTLNGADGVTIAHTKGDTNYALKVLPTGTNAQDVGEVSYVKAANTVTVYNTGRPRLAADYELSVTA